jgi:hypothetical protein
VPGDRFSEAEIGTRLGVSRTPVREALFRLRNEGFLDVESKSGWFVQADRLRQARAAVRPARRARDRQRGAAVRQRVDDRCPSCEALKAVWLVPAAERLTDGREVGPLDEPSTPRWCAPPATTRSRACTGT